MAIYNYVDDKNLTQIIGGKGDPQPAAIIEVLNPGGHEMYYGSRSGLSEVAGYEGIVHALATGAFTEVAPG